MDKNGPYVVEAPRSRPTSAPEIVDYLILLALKMKASDLHLGVNPKGAANEPYLLRFRIHGKLQAIKCEFLNNLYKEVIMRFKVLSSINSTDQSTPQDGQATAVTPEGPIVLRVNTIPSGEYEDICIRIQRTEKHLSLEQLSMTREMYSKVTQLIRQKSGLIVINGPAGSGKSSTIYSILSTLASSERKIVTAEDPVESRLPFVSHFQVSQRISFANMSRAFMRQDADVIFIGEIRDPESAEATVQLAQTGHLVVTTLHTRDSIGVISRLEAFGIHANFIASTLIGSLAQRLVPLLCKRCKQEDPAAHEKLAGFHHAPSTAAGTKIYKANPEGCEKCTGGTAGRLPIFELFTPDAEIADLVNRKAPRADIEAAARAKGMKSLAEEALIRVYAGYVGLDSIQNYLTATNAPLSEAA